MFNNVKLKLLLIDNDMQGAHLAKRAGVTITTVSHWINGRHEPNQYNIIKLKKIFKIKKGYFNK